MDQDSTMVPAGTVSWACHAAPWLRLCDHQHPVVLIKEGGGLIQGFPNPHVGKLHYNFEFSCNEIVICKKNIIHIIFPDINFKDENFTVILLQ